MHFNSNFTCRQDWVLEEQSQNYINYSSYIRYVLLCYIPAVPPITNRYTVVVLLGSTEPLMLIVKVAKLSSSDTDTKVDCQLTPTT